MLECTYISRNSESKTPHDVLRAQVLLRIPRTRCKKKKRTRNRESCSACISETTWWIYIKFDIRDPHWKL